MIGKTISHYKIIEKLGEGGMGVVYKAEDTKLKRTIALKFLSIHSLSNEVEKTRFLHEAQAPAALDHPNICTVHEIDETEGQTFIAMAYIKGQSLKDKIDSGPLKIEEVLHIAYQIADGLQEAHEKGIVHRDIKSSNIMLSSRGQPKITDFGLAKLIDRTKLTKAGTTVGTIAYMSPEQTLGVSVDHRTDIWSFGVLLYEMITGRLPFRGDYDQAVIYSIVNEEPELVTGVRSGVPMELERMINKTMAKDPAERYQHMDEILVDLRAIAKEAQIKIKAEESISGIKVDKKDEESRSLKYKKHRKESAVLIAVVTITSVLILTIFIMQRQRSTFIANRIVVVPFENKTGDESLDMLGQMAAEMTTQGISQIKELEAVPFITVMDSYREEIEKFSAFTVAEQNKAGILVTGSYYLQGEDLFFRATIMDAEHKKLLAGLSPVKRSSEVQEVVLEKLSSQILGALAIHFQYNIQAGQTYIPSFEAYKEFQAGREFFGNNYEKARNHLQRSIEIDSLFTAPMLYLAVLYNNQDQYSRADSIFDLINKHREALPPLDRSLLDYFIASNSGDRVRAMRFLREAEELAPKNYLIKFFVGLNARSLNLPQFAVDTYAEFGYERMIKAFRGHMGLRDLADALYMLGEYDEALNVIELSRQHFPDIISNLSYEAILHAARGQIREVNRVIDESFQVSVSAPGSVMRSAAIALRAHGYKDAAHEILRRAFAWYQSRSSGDQRFSIARILYCDEQWTEAQAYLEQLYKECPDNQEYMGYRGVIAARLGDKEKANIILEELRNKNEPYLFGSHLYWCACIAALLGEHQRAVDLLREAFGQGYRYGMYVLLDMNLESLKNYPSYVELMRPKG